MRLSRYVMLLEDVWPGEHVLYDVIGDRYVGLDGRALAALERWRRAPPAPGAEAEGAAALAGMGFLVGSGPAGDAEDAARLAGAEALAEGPPGLLHLTLFPTLACNLACTYCIQRDHPRQGHAPAEVEAATLAWIERTVAGAPPERLTLEYLGGEPLTRKDYVLRTAARVAAAARARGAAFDWGLATNGVLLDVAFARAMAAHGRGLITVTLDGDRETHDAGRVWRDGRGTFDEVLRNTAEVARACPEVAVRVNGNFRPGQRASFERLLGRLELEGLAGHLEEVSFQPVLDAGGCGAACGSGQGSEAVVQLGQQAAERGLSRRPAGGIDGVAPCALHWRRAWVVDPAGHLYRCFAVAGRPEMAVGDVFGGPARKDPLTAARPWAACAACPFAPVCRGGCIGGRYVADGVAAVDCPRPSLELRFRREVARRYLEEFHPEAQAPSPGAAPPDRAPSRLLA